MQRPQQAARKLNAWQMPLGQCRSGLALASVEFSSWHPQTAAAWPRTGSVQGVDSAVRPLSC